MAYELHAGGGGGGSEPSNPVNPYKPRVVKPSERDRRGETDTGGGGDGNGNDARWITPEEESGGGGERWTDNPVYTPPEEEEPVYELSPAEKEQLSYAKKPIDVTPVEEIVAPEVTEEEKPKEEEPVVTTPVVTSNGRTANDAFNSQVSSESRDNETKFYEGTETEEEPVSTPKTQSPNISNPVPGVKVPTPNADANLGNLEAFMELGRSAGLEGQELIDYARDQVLRTSNPFSVGGPNSPAPFVASGVTPSSGVPAQPGSYEAAVRAVDNALLDAAARNAKRVDYPAKVGMVINNAINDTLDDFDNIGAYEDFLAKNMKNEVFASEEDRVKRELELKAQWDAMVANGEVDVVERPDVTSNEVREKIDNMRAMENSRVAAMKKKAEERSDRLTAEYDAAQRAAEAAGLIEGTPEFDQYVYDYREKYKDAGFSPAYMGAEPNKPDNPFSSIGSANVEAPSVNDLRYTGGEGLMRDNPFGLDSFNVQDEFAEPVSYRDNVILEQIYSALPDTWSESEKGDYLKKIYDDPNYRPDPGTVAGMEPPGFTADGIPNYTLELLGRKDADGKPLYDADTVFQTFVDMQGNQKAMQDGGDVAWKQPITDLLNDPTLTPEDRAGLRALLVTKWWGGDPVRGRDLYERQYFDGTAAQYERLATLFAEKLGLDYLVKQGIITDADIKNFFFKAFKPGPGQARPKTGAGYGYGYGYPYRGWGGGGYGGGGGGYYGGGGGSSSGTKQNENRVYNIMKNWSF